jgi:hypothetical protein
MIHFHDGIHGQLNAAIAADYPNHYSFSYKHAFHVGNGFLEASGSGPSSGYIGKVFQQLILISSGYI